MTFVKRTRGCFVVAKDPAARLTRRQIVKSSALLNLAASSMLCMPVIEYGRVILGRGRMMVDGITCIKLIDRRTLLLEGGSVMSLIPDGC